MEINTNLVTVDNDDVDIYAILKFPVEMSKSSKFACEKLYPVLAPGMQKLLQYIEQEKKIHPGTEKVNPVIWLAQYLIRNEERTKLTVYEQRVLQHLKNLIFNEDSISGVEGGSDEDEGEEEKKEDELVENEEADNVDEAKKELVSEDDNEEFDVMESSFEELVSTPENELLDEPTFEKILVTIKNRIEEATDLKDYHEIVYSDVKRAFEGLSRRSRFRYVILGSAGSFLPTPEKNSYISEGKKVNDSWKFTFPSGNEIVSFVYNDGPIPEETVEKYKRILQLLYQPEEDYYDTIAPMNYSGSSGGEELDEIDDEEKPLADTLSNDIEEEEIKEEEVVEKISKVPKTDDGIPKKVDWNLIFEELVEETDLIQSQLEYFSFLKTKGVSMLSSCFTGASVIFKFVQEEDASSPIPSIDEPKTLFRSMIFSSKNRENVFEFIVVEDVVTAGTVNLSEDAVQFLERVSDHLIKSLRQVMEREDRTRADHQLLSSLRKKQMDSRSLVKFLNNDVNPILIDRVPGSEIRILPPEETRDNYESDESEKSSINDIALEGKSGNFKVVRIEKKGLDGFSTDEHYFVEEIGAIIRNFNGSEFVDENDEEENIEGLDPKEIKMMKIRKELSKIRSEDDYREFEDKIVLHIHDEVPETKCELVTPKHKPPVSPTFKDGGEEGEYEEKLINEEFEKKVHEWGVKDGEGVEYVKIQVEGRDIDEREAWFCQACAHTLGMARRTFEFYERMRSLQAFWKSGSPSKDEKWKGEFYLFVLKDLISLEEEKITSGYVCEPMKGEEGEIDEEGKGKFAVMRNLPQEATRKVGQALTLDLSSLMETGRPGHPTLSDLPNEEGERVITWNDRDGQILGCLLFGGSSPSTHSEEEENEEEEEEDSLIIRNKKEEDKWFNDRIIEYNEEVNQILCQLEDRKRLKILGEQLIKWLETTMRRKVTFGFLVPDAKKLQDEAIEEIIKKSQLFSNSFFVDGDSQFGVDLPSLRRSLREGQRVKTEKYWYEPVIDYSNNVIGVISVTCPVPDPTKKPSKKKKKKKKKKTKSDGKQEEFTDREEEQLETVFAIFHDAFRYIQMMKLDKVDFEKTLPKLSLDKEVDESDLSSETYFLKRLLMKTREKLMGLSSNHISELVGYNSPPRAVFKVMKAVLYLLNRKKKELSSWNICRRIVKQMKSSFFEKLISYDPTRKLRKMKFINIRIVLKNLTFLKMEKTSYPAMLLYSFLVVVLDLRKQSVKIRKNRKRMKKMKKRIDETKEEDEEEEEEEVEGEGEDDDEEEEEEESDDGEKEEEVSTTVNEEASSFNFADSLDISEGLQEGEGEGEGLNEEEEELDDYEEEEEEEEGEIDLENGLNPIVDDEEDDVNVGDSVEFGDGDIIVNEDEDDDDSVNFQ